MPAARTDWKTWALSLVMALMMLLAGGAISSFEHRLEAAEVKSNQNSIDIAVLKEMKTQLDKIESKVDSVNSKLDHHMSK